jgi:predicted Rossmann fold nucleotide-binding protein DprA/Smf involved in DNA uptake
MSTPSLGPDGQAIALACSRLALAGETDVKPLTAREWHEVSNRLARSSWGRPAELLGHTPAEIARELQLPLDAAQRIAMLLSRGGQLAFELERLGSRGIWVTTCSEETYPQRLERLLHTHAPPVLYGAGSPDVLTRPALAIVGSRDADSGALELASMLGRLCARQDVTVVSGAARGVDTQAMQAAIEMGGSALGVTVEPLERLVRRAATRAPLSDGALTLITPFHPTARWQAGNAMLRNRIVYALAQAAVVAASAAGSGGTWSGAIENLRHGWVPLYVRCHGDAGSQELAQAGAITLADPTVADLDIRSLFHPPTGDVRPPLLAAEPPNGTAPSAPQTGTDHVPPETCPEPSTQAKPDDDLFWVIWPRLQSLLREPQTPSEVASSLALRPAQAKAWLDRAVHEDLATVQTRPRKRYVSHAFNEHQLRLT